MKKTFKLTGEKKYGAASDLERDGDYFLCVDQLKRFFPSASRKGDFSLILSNKPFPQSKSVTIKNWDWKTPEGHFGYLYGSARAALREVFGDNSGTYKAHFRLIYHKKGLDSGT